MGLFDPIANPTREMVKCCEGVHGKESAII